MKLPFSVTSDSIALRGAGVVTITQPEKGHRFTLDSILLADFCRVRPGERVLEPGAGTGIISLLLAKKHPRAAFIAVEIQPSLASLGEKNIVDNGLAGRMQMVRMDLQRIGRTIAPGALSVIVANPPYIKEGAGRPSPDRLRRTARQAHQSSLGTWLNLHRYLKNGGRYCLIFPAVRLAELISLMRMRSLEPKRLRLVHPYADRPAALVLVEAIKQGGTGLEVLSALIVHGQDGTYSDEMKDLYRTSAEERRSRP
jgi:tRNA1Val (adenine37-N6)-methyltransferase